MSEHPIDVLRVAVACKFDCSEHGRTVAAPRAVEQLEQAMRAFFNEYDGEHGEYAPFDDTEAQMRAALALFDRKEQTP